MWFCSHLLAEDLAELLLDRCVTQLAQVHGVLAGSRLLEDNCSHHAIYTCHQHQQHQSSKLRSSRAHAHFNFLTGNHAYEK